MNSNEDMIYNIKRKMLVKYPRFGSEVAVANIEFKEDLPFHTAATDGKNIYVDPNYFQSLNDNDKLFLIAHEIMHNKFMHMYRLVDKEGKKRDLELWNIATDAIINANLERDGFKIIDGAVNMPKALNYSAEEFYQILLQEKQKQQEQNKEENQEQIQGGSDRQNQNGERKNCSQDNVSQGNEQNNSQDSNKENQQTYKGDDHSLWEEAFKSIEQQEKEQKPKNDTQKKQEDLIEEQKDNNFDEKNEFEDNRREKRERFKVRREKTEQDIRGKQEGTIEFERVGESKEAIDWKVLLRREVEKTETIWSQRRSIAENNYAYRLEENDIEDEAETEIMIDVSGSVHLNLVKAFLRQIKPILKQSKLKVGCFNEKFWGFVDIKNVKDIDNFTIPRRARGYYARTEDWDLAVRSFTKKKEINKIVFTDGYPCPGNMPKEDLKRENVIWLVYGNKEFKPCCGKVINITERQLEQLYQIEKNSFAEDLDR